MKCVPTINSARMILWVDILKSHRTLLKEEWTGGAKRQKSIGTLFEHKDLAYLNADVDIMLIEKDILLLLEQRKNILTEH